MKYNNSILPCFAAVKGIEIADEIIMYFNPVFAQMTASVSELVTAFNKHLDTATVIGKVRVLLTLSLYEVRPNKKDGEYLEQKMTELAKDNTLEIMTLLSGLSDETRRKMITSLQRDGKDILVEENLSEFTEYYTSRVEYIGNTFNKNRLDMSDLKERTVEMIFGKLEEIIDTRVSDHMDWMNYLLMKITGHVISGVRSKSYVYLVQGKCKLLGIIRTLYSVDDLKKIYLELARCEWKKYAHIPERIKK